jgi:hypothetical protein
LRGPFSGRIACLTLALCGLLAERGAAEVFLSPRAEVLTGYESNRLTTGASGGSGFLAGSPLFEVTHFASDALELWGLLSYVRKEYLRDGFSYIQTSQASMGLWQVRGAWEGGLTLTAGDHDDGALSTEDATWCALTPGIAVADLRGRRYSLSASVARYSYESRATSEGEAINGTQWSLRPGAVWPLTPTTTVWGEAWLERFSSSEETEDYLGGGIALGLNYAPPARSRAGVSVELGLRDYEERVGDSASQADGTAPSLEVWYGLRLTSRVELVFQGKAGSYWSNDRSSEYDQLQLQAGLSLTDDFQLGSSHF